MVKQISVLDLQAERLRLDGPLARLHRARLIGSGTSTIVLSHGLGTDQTAWEQVIPMLDLTAYKLFLFDLPGAGPLLPEGFRPELYSSIGRYADDLLDLLDEVGIEKCHFVGHSVSGMIGVLAAIEDPNQFAQLILLNSSPRYLNDRGYRGGFEPSDLDGLFDAMAANYQAWVAGFAAMAIAVEMPRAVDHFTRGFLEMRPDITATIARMIFESDLRGLLKKVTVPTVLVHSRNDVAVPSEVANYLSDNIDGSRLVWIEAEGHLPHLTSPETVAQAIQQTLLP